MIALIDMLMYVIKDNKDSEHIIHIIKQKTPFGHLPQKYVLTFQPTKDTFLDMVKGLNDKVYVEAYDEKPYVTLIVSEANTEDILKFVQYEDFYNARNEHGRLVSALMQNKEKLTISYGSLPDGFRKEE